MHFVIGDVHGCFHTLTKLLEKIKIADENAKLIFVGDYVDRGFLNKETVELMIKLQSEGAVCLCGNHDNVINYLLNDEYIGRIEEMIWGKPSLEKVFQWWCQNGLLETIESYGVTAHRRTFPPYSQSLFTDAAHEFREKVPQSHKDFFASLPLFWEIDTHFACHAYMRPGEPLPRSLNFITSDRFEETLWSRFPNNFILNGQTSWDKIGVFGHTPTKSYGSPVPIKVDKVRLIDTGVFLGNYLCAYSCEQDDWILQSTDGRDIGKEDKIVEL